MKQPSRSCLVIIIMCLANLSVSAQNPNSIAIYKPIQVIDTFNHHDTTSLVWIHNFSYDEKARPDTDTWQSFNWKNQLVYTDKLVYSYDEGTNRLIARTGKASRYYYYYDNLGNLRRITLENFRNGLWSLIEETILTRTSLADGKTKVNIIWNKILHPAGKADSTSCYFNIDYIINTTNTVEEKYIYRYQYRDFKTPLYNRFIYDNHPNPVQQITLERFFDWEFDNQNSNNVVTKSTGTKSRSIQQYTYNEMGYPSECKIDKVRTRVFHYDYIQIPLQKNDGNYRKLNLKTGLLLYPNPAQTEVTMQAENISNGNAVVRIYTITGMPVREVNYSVENRKLQAFLNLYGLPQGNYLFELITQQEKLTNKLIIH